MAHKIILDTDPGIDDAMAIFTAIAHEDIELIGLTTVFGNVSVERAANNALWLTEQSGVEIPVCKGCAKPLKKDPLPFPDFVHGVDGFGNLDLPTAKGELCALDSANFIIEQLQQFPNEITLVAIGPLTNLATVLKRSPDIVTKVKQVVLMGGTIHADGNVSPVAEANIFSDPDAAELVMAAEWSVVMIGLDTTHQVSFNRKLFANIAVNNSKVGKFMQRAADYYINFYMSVRDQELTTQKASAKPQKDDSLDACYGHDICAVLYVVNPDIFEEIEGSICVATEGVAMGQTIINHRKLTSYLVEDWNNRPFQKACMNVDADEIRSMFYSSMTNDFWS